MLDSFGNLRWADIADVVVVGLLLWALVAWARRVHAGLALFGLAFLAGFYLVALQLELQLTAWFFQGFFAVLVVLLVVVFQDDLRRLFEQIAVLSLRRRPARTPVDGGAILVRTLLQLAEQRTGALLVLPGREPLERHLQGGTPLDAVISEALLCSIFDPGSPGHDGAVLVQVFTNLVRNAIHALVPVENRDRHIWLSTGMEEGYVLARVRDNGIGIDAAALPKIFDYGFTTRTAGSGIGLHYCKHAIEEIGGRVEVTAELNQGATFTIYLHNA